VVQDDILRNEPSAGRDIDLAANSDNYSYCILFAKKIKKGRALKTTQAAK